MTKVADDEYEYPLRWAAVESIAGKIGCTALTLLYWVPKAEPVPIAPATKKARTKPMGRENAEL